MSKNCIITGGSSGIGLATAREMFADGFTVYEISRRAEGPNAVRHFSCDVTDEAAVQKTVAAIRAEAGTIDVLVNCAGFGISGAVEFTELADAKRQIEVNFFGMVNMNKAVIPVMREQGFGRIINLSSVAGTIPIPFQTYYSASKAAINSYTMATANEIKPFGVQMCAVQPGDMATGFTAARKKSAVGDDIYEGRISRSVAGMEKDETTGSSPDVAGRFIRRVATKKSVKPINTIGFKYQFFCFLVKILPAKFVNYLVGQLYAK